jgi:predicted alpha/beta superfamily hydrolase
MRGRFYSIMAMALYSIYTLNMRPVPAQEIPGPLDGRHHTLTGTFHKHAAFHSQFLAADRDVLVYLPPDYEKNTRTRYPVLYLHDGQNLFDGATSFIPGKEWRVDETAEELIRRKAIEPVIIVGIYNTGGSRLSEYTPTKTPRFKDAGKADAYGKMIVEELKPFVDKRYRTRKDAANTALGGSSLGGLVSLYLGLKRPEVFGKLAVLSPSIWWDNKVIVKRVKALKSRPDLKIWLDMGTHEGNPPSQERNIDDARALKDALVAKGWKLDTELKYTEVQGAEHNEEAWAARVEPMLRFLFGRG